MFDLQGRVAAVTGGNGGIGLGMARGLARAGATAVMVACTPAARRGAIDNLAGIAVLLASSASGFVSRAANPVDGGYAAQG